MKLKKIKILETAKLNGILGGLAGLVAGILYSFGGLVIDALVTLQVITTQETPGLSYGTVLAFGALIGMPLIFAFCGFVFTIVGAYFYNLIAK